MTTHSRFTGSIHGSSAVLWASAVVVLALVIVQAGRLPGNSAFGHMVADRAEYTVLTADSGKGGDEEPDEILCVLDSREQMLLVYEIEDARRGGLQLRDGYSLAELFTRAKR